MYSPLRFKENVLNLCTQERPMVIIYAEGNYKVKVHRATITLTQEKNLRLIIVR